MDEPNYTVSNRLNNLARVLVLIGVITISIGFFLNPDRTWANFLLNNYYFTSLAIGGMFFLAIQYITQSGWASQFVRIPYALGMYLPVAGILMLLLFFGMHSIYHWTDPEAAASDALIQHKSPYLNTPFFFIRIVVSYSLWILMLMLLRNAAKKEDQQGGLEYFEKSEFLSKVFIFIVAITFSLLTFDLIMSIDVHWFSTIFAVKNFVSAFYHATVVILLITILLNRQGLFQKLRKSHLQDYSRYIFILGIIWAYMWFIQYLLIWFTNIPEETIYYVTRMDKEWRTLFYLNIILNFVVPFSILLSGKLDSSKTTIIALCAVLIVGHWIDLYLQIMPGSVGELHIGYIELGSYAGFLGLFIYIVNRSLGTIPLIPKNHPYLKESLNH